MGWVMEETETIRTYCESKRHGDARWHSHDMGNGNAMDVPE